jgi:hypothetical protein
MTAFQELFDNHAFLAYEKQMKLAALIGEHTWELDTEMAVVKFGADLIFPVQFLGSESSITNTWLWADANKNASFPDESLISCCKVRSIGQELGIADFEDDKFVLGRDNSAPSGHNLAMLATCLGQGSCYYRGDHENGAVFFTIQDNRIDSVSDLNEEGFCEVFTRLMWEIGDMKKQVLSYLKCKGYISPNFDGEEVTFKLHSGEELKMYFRPTENGGMQVGFIEQTP